MTIFFTGENFISKQKKVRVTDNIPHKHHSTYDALRNSAWFRREVYYTAGFTKKPSLSNNFIASVQMLSWEV